MTWKLVKAEIKYNGSLLFAAYCIYLFMVLFLHLGPRILLIKEIPPRQQVWTAMWIMLLMNWIMSTGAFFFTGIVKEKRNRQYLELPLSTNSIALSRLIIIGLIWLTSGLLFLLLLTMSGYLELFFFRSTYLTTFCIHLGVLFFWGCYMFWKKDLKSVVFIKMKIFSLPVKKLLSLFLDLMVGIFYLFFTLSPQIRDSNIKIFRSPEHPLRKAVTWLFETGNGIIIFSILGICMSLLMVFTFTRRKTYMD